MITYILQEFYPKLQSGKSIIGIDYGQKKMGIAISSPDQKIALPLEVYISPDDAEKIKYAGKIILKYEACAIIVGYPLNMNGTLSEQSKITVNFAHKLSSSGLPIFMQDERLSSKAANNFLKAFGIKRADRNKMDDKVAAGMILETFLGSIDKLRNHGL